MSIVTVVIAFFAPVSVMIGLYVRVWWETVKRQRELVHLQAGKKASSKSGKCSKVTTLDALRGRASHGRRALLSTFLLVVKVKSAKAPKIF